LKTILSGLGTSTGDDLDLFCHAALAVQHKHRLLLHNAIIDLRNFEQSAIEHLRLVLWKS